MVIKYGLINIYLTQMGKLIFYFVIEFVNMFYNRGTGINVINSGFFIVVEIVMALDFFYYLNIKDSVKVNTIDKSSSFMGFIITRIIITILQGIFIIFMCFYSLDTPYN